MPNDKLTKIKVIPCNFGQENCQMLTLDFLMPLLDQYDPQDQYLILACDLLKVVHLNESFPENHNLRQIKGTDDRQIEVYYDNSWSSMYWLEVIREFLRGNLFRVKQLVDDDQYHSIEKSVLDNLENLYSTFWNTLNQHTY